MRDTEAALKWIVTILINHKIQFQISGGFAAKLYGSRRSLADIDIDVDKSFFTNIYTEVKKYIVYGPGRYVDLNWDLTLMTLKYKGQVIDLSTEAKIFDQNLKKWVTQKVDFSSFCEIDVYGITIPVIKKTDLILYKSKLLRKVDKIDIDYLLN